MYTHCKAHRVQNSVSSLCCLLLFLSASAAAEQPASVDVNFGDDQPGMKAAKGQLMSVVVTGVGTDPEMAKQNAFSNAIEQAVGVLVDAKTIVEKDQVVTDEVLTYSRGFVEEFQAVRQWEKQGLHYVRIHAQVSMDKIGEKLKANDIAVHDVPGELVSLRIQNAVLSEREAAKILRNALAGFSTKQFLDVSIKEKPVMERQGDEQATVTVKVELAANLAAWQKFFASFTPVIRRIASEQFREEVEGSVRWIYYPKSPKDGYIVYVFQDVTPSGTTAYYDGYVVATPLSAEIQDVCHSQQRNELHFALVDRDGAVIDSANRPLYQWGSRAPWSLDPIIMSKAAGFVGPLPWRKGRGLRGTFYYTQKIAVEHKFTLNLKDLAKVAKCVAHIEEPEPAGPSK